jgi:hypothetical protein
MKILSKIITTVFSLTLLLNSGNTFTMDKQPHTNDQASPLRNMSKQTAASIKRANLTLTQQTDLDSNYMLSCIIDSSEVPGCLAEGANPNSIDTSGKTALHYPQVLKKQDLIQTLMEYGADVEAIDNNGFTPLHYAVSNNNIKATNFLLDHAAVDPNISGTNKQTNAPTQPPLHYAKTKKLCSALYAAGAQASTDDVQKLAVGQKQLEKNAKKEIVYIARKYREVLAALNVFLKPTDLSSMVLDYAQIPETFEEHLKQQQELKKSMRLERMSTKNTMNLTEPDTDLIRRGIVSSGLSTWSNMPVGRTQSSSSSVSSRPTSPARQLTPKPMSNSTHTSAPDSNASSISARYDLDESKEIGNAQQPTHQRDEDNPSSLKHNPKKPNK